MGLKAPARHAIDERLEALGLILPSRSKPAGNYLAASRSDSLLFISGQFPLENGRLKHAGRIGRDLTPDDGYRATRLAALNVLSHLRHETDGWRQLDCILRLDGHISSAPHFHEQPRVLDGASDLFKQVLQSRAGHARTVFAHAALPLNSSVELVVIAGLRGSELDCADMQGAAHTG